MKAGDRYRLGFALVAWLLLSVSAVLLPSPGHRVESNLANVLIGCTLLLSAYTLLALAFNLQNQVRALKSAGNPTERKLWLGFQILLVACAATAIIWSAWPR